MILETRLVEAHKARLGALQEAIEKLPNSTESANVRNLLASFLVNVDEIVVAQSPSTKPLPVQAPVLYPSPEPKPAQVQNPAPILPRVVQNQPNVQVKTPSQHVDLLNPTKGVVK